MIAPLTITIRVFQSDNGWSYEVSLWTGVNTLTCDPPTKRYTSARAYKTATTAWNNARTFADRLVRA